MKRYLNSQFLISFGCSLFVVYLTAVPLGMLLYGSIRTAPPGDPAASYTFQNYANAYVDPEFYFLVVNSLYFAVGISVVSFFIGTYLAWITERTNTPFKKVFVVAALIPFIIPGILSTIAWILLLSPKIGLINLALKHALGLGFPPFNIYSMGGMIWAEAIHMYPVVFLLMSAAFRNMDTSLEEASLTAGAGIFTTFRRITFPLMRPAMFGSLLIVFIRGIESFEVPALVGVPARISVFATKIFLAIHRFPSDFGLAGAYGITLLIISVGGVLLYQRMTNKQRRYATVTGRGHCAYVIDLGAWKYVTCAGAFFIFFISVVLPVAILIWSSLVPFYGVPSGQLLSRLTMSNYQYVVNHSLVWTAFKNSLYLSAGSATLVMFLTAVISWITVKSKIRGGTLLDYAAFTPIAIPGIVLGVSIMSVYLVLPIPVYGTLWILLLAYMTKFMPYGMRAASVSMIQISKELEDASLVCGACWLQTLRRIILPLLAPGFVAGWIYISIKAFRELSVSILLYSYDSTVLSIISFNLWEEGQYTYVCALGIMMIVLLIFMASVARMFGVKIGIAE